MLMLSLRVAMDQKEPLTLRLLLWLSDNLFLAVAHEGCLTRLLKLTPSDSQDPKDTLEIRY